MDGWRRELGWRHVVGSLILGVLVFLAIGFVAGGYSPPGPPPSINFTEGPAEIASDAMIRLESEDFTVRSNFVREDLDTGERSVGYDEWASAEISHSTGRYQIRWILPGAESENTTYQLFRNPYSLWFSDPGDDWQEDDIPFGREIDRRWLGGIARGIGSPSVGSHLEDYRWEVESNTTSEITIHSSDARAADALFSQTSTGNASVRVEISKSPTPHLKRVVIVEYDRGFRWNTTYTVSEIGNTTVRRPDSIPPVTVQELTNRIAIGWKRLWPL